MISVAREGAPPAVRPRSPPSWARGGGAAPPSVGRGGRPFWGGKGGARPPPGGHPPPSPQKTLLRRQRQPLARHQQRQPTQTHPRRPGSLTLDLRINPLRFQ